MIDWRFRKSPPTGDEDESIRRIRPFIKNGKDLLLTGTSSDLPRAYPARTEKQPEVIRPLEDKNRRSKCVPRSAAQVTETLAADS